MKKCKICLIFSLFFWYKCECLFYLFIFRELLDVSGNLIENIDDEPFAKLLKLKTLNLSNNRIKKISQFKLPDSIQFLSLENNRLQSFEFYKIPESLTHFDIQNNLLQELILDSPTNLKVCKMYKYKF